MEWVEGVSMSGIWMTIKLYLKIKSYPSMISNENKSDMIAKLNF